MECESGFKCLCYKKYKQFSIVSVVLLKFIISGCILTLSTLCIRLEFLHQNYKHLVSIQYSFVISFTFSSNTSDMTDVDLQLLFR